jgi:hypothetical protein
MVLAAVTAFASIAFPLDPWHEVTLVAMFLAWSVVGVLLPRHAPRSARREKMAV